MTDSVSEEDVYQSVGQVMHPAISKSLVELGMVKDIALERGTVTLTLALPVLGIPVFVKDYLVNSLRNAVAALGAELNVKIEEMNDGERQAFLAMEQESWKGLP